MLDLQTNPKLNFFSVKLQQLEGLFSFLFSKAAKYNDDFYKTQVRYLTSFGYLPKSVICMYVRLIGRDKIATVYYLGQKIRLSFAYCHTFPVDAV